MHNEKNILDGLNESFFELDNDFRITGLNTNAGKLFRGETSDIQGKIIWDLIPQAAGTPLYTAVLKVAATRVPFRGEFVWPLTGEFVFFSMAPAPNGILVLCFDIAEARETHRLVCESEEHFRTLVENTPDAISRWNKELKPIYSNPAFIRKIGVGHPARSGKIDVHTGLPSEIAGRWREKLQQVFDSRAPREDYDFYPALDQTTVYFFTRMVPEFGHDGSVQTVLSISRDVTDMKRVEHELEESRHFIRQITDAAPEITYVLDLEAGRIIYANQRLVEVFGAENAADFRQNNLFMHVVHPGDSQRFHEHMALLSRLDDGQKSELRVRMKAAAGDWHWFYFSDRVFKRRENGRVWQTIGLVHDITSEMKAKEELNSNLSLLAQTESVGHIGSWVQNLQTGRIDWSAEAYRIFGYEPFSVVPSSELVAKHMDPEDNRKMGEAFSLAIATRNSASFRYPIRTRNGQQKHVFFSLGFDEKFPDNLLGVMQDITDETELHRQVTERQQFIETIIDNSVDRFLAFDQDLKILLWNKKCEEYYGRKKEDALGRSMTEVFPRLPDQPVVLEAFRRAFSGERAYVPPEQELYAPSISERFYIPLKDDNGKVYCVIGILHDVTKAVKAGQAQRELNRSLEEKNRELEEKNEEISSFAFIASHDLKEPLRKIHTYSHWLREREAAHLSEKGKEYTQRISEAVKRMDVLIAEIMVLTKVNSEREKLWPVDLNTVLQTVLSQDLLQLVQETGARVTAGRLPDVNGNESQLFFLFKNIIHNGIMFQEDGNEPHIDIRAEEVPAAELPPGLPAKEAVYLRVSFKDNGIGFNPKYMRKAFQVFQRLHPKHGYQGTGMGLAVCKKIMEVHHGFITAESEEGKGSVFSCYFPLPPFSQQA